MFKPVRIGLIGPLPAHGPISVCPCCAARSLLWTRSTPYRAVWADRWNCGQGRHRQARCGLARCKEPMVKSVATTIGFCNTSVKLKSMEVFQEATSSLVVPSATGRPGAAKSQPPERDIFCTCARDAIQAPARRHLWRQVQAAAESKPSSASLGPARDELRRPQAAACQHAFMQAAQFARDEGMPISAAQPEHTLGHGMGNNLPGRSICVRYHPVCKACSISSQQARRVGSGSARSCSMARCPCVERLQAHTNTSRSNATRLRPVSAPRGAPLLIGLPHGTAKLNNAWRNVSNG